MAFKINSTMDFGKALCEHFGLPTDQVSNDMKVHAERDGIFSVTLNIMLTAVDLASIADRMPGRTKVLVEEAANRIRTDGDGRVVVSNAPTDRTVDATAIEKATRPLGRRSVTDMAQVSATLRLKVTIAWWWPVYAQAVAALGHLTGLEPNWQRFDYWARKVLRTKVVAAGKQEREHDN